MSDKKEKIKEGDYFDFRWKDSRYMSDHCFDGRLKAIRFSNGEIVLRDTYWSDSSQGRTFSVEEAYKLGELNYICNLKDLESIEEHDICYYKPQDIIDLSHQHGCYQRFGLRKGATKDKNTILAKIKEKIDEYESDIEFKEQRIKRLQEQLKEVQEGNLDIYI